MTKMQSKIIKRIPQKSKKPTKKSKGAMSYDEVKAYSQEFLLPCKVIYELQSEFSCLKEMANENAVAQNKSPLYRKSLVATRSTLKRAPTLELELDQMT